MGEDNVISSKVILQLIKIVYVFRGGVDTISRIELAAAFIDRSNFVSVRHV